MRPLRAHSDHPRTQAPNWHDTNCTEEAEAALAKAAKGGDAGVRWSVQPEPAKHDRQSVVDTDQGVHKSNGQSGRDQNV